MMAKKAFLLPFALAFLLVASASAYGDVNNSSTNNSTEIAQYEIAQYLAIYDQVWDNFNQTANTGWYTLHDWNYNPIGSNESELAQLDEASSTQLDEVLLNLILIKVKFNETDYPAEASDLRNHTIWALQAYINFAAQMCVYVDEDSDDFKSAPVKEAVDAFNFWRGKSLQDRARLARLLS